VFEKRALRRIFVPKRDEIIEGYIDKYMVRSLILFTKYY
jgi:hypothetical protein